jgi:energy-converting hydrogenase A subunit R
LRILITDGEGPITKNDNAFELSSYFIPDGENFFAVVSSYDDVLAYIIKKKGYKAGDTLKLILPFLKAYGVTDEAIRDYSRKNILLMPKAKEALTYIKEIMPVYIVSTSYEPYVKAVCEALNFPIENVYCTKLSIDKYKLGENEAEKLKNLSIEISQMKPIKIPEKASSLKDLSIKDKETINRLNEIFWKELPVMKAYKMIKEVNPIGGFEKAKAVKEILKKNKSKFSEAIYIGDSITDVQALRLIKKNNGLAISFNGNNYALIESEIAVMAYNATAIAVISELFLKNGKQAVIKLIEEKDKSLKLEIKEAWMKLKNEDVKLEKIKKENLPELIKESLAYRKMVRGEKIGELG